MERARKGAAVLIWMLFLVVALIWCGKRSYEWDLLAYAACAIELSESDPAAVHAEVYQTLEAEAPERINAALLFKNAYRKKVSEDSGAFSAQLPFYRGRALYIAAIAALIALGSSPIGAVFQVSAAAGVSLLVALGLWLRKRGGSSAGLTIGNLLVLMALGFFIKAPAMATPDAMSAALLLWGAYLLLETRRLKLGLLVLGLSLAARADHIALVAPLVLWCASGWSGGKRVSGRQLMAAALLYIAVLSACTVGRETYSPWVVFHHTFFRLKTFPLAETPPLDLALWTQQVLRSLPKFASFRPLLFTLAGLAAIVMGYRRAGWRDPGLGLAAVALVGMAVHFTLFPALWPRLMFPYWVLAALALGRGVTVGSQSRSDQASP